MLSMVVRKKDIIGNSVVKNVQSVTTAKKLQFKTGKAKEVWIAGGQHRIAAARQVCADYDSHISDIEQLNAEAAVDTAAASKAMPTHSVIKTDDVEKLKAMKSGMGNWLTTLYDYGEQMILRVRRVS